MKDQFLHEDHNRQDKKYKPNYREDIRSRPRSQILPDLATPRFRISLTLRRELDELSPGVADALHRFDPAIDLRKVTNAIRSALVDTVCRLHCEPQVPKIIAAIRRSFPTKPATSQSIPIRFLQWHDETAQRLIEYPRAEAHIPEEFQLWLRRPAFRAKTAATQ